MPDMSKISPQQHKNGAYITARSHNFDSDDSAAGTED
jgi:hypothetical protein